MFRTMLAAAALALATLTTTACTAAPEMDWASLREQAMVTPPPHPLMAAAPPARPAAKPVAAVAKATPTPAKQDQAEPSSAPAHAAAASAPAEKATITVPYGDWLKALIDLVYSILTVCAAGMVAYLPFVLRTAIQAYGVDRLLNQALGFALNAIPGAAQGQMLTIEVGNQVLATAVQFIIDEAPQLIKRLGGEEMLRRKLFALMHVLPAVSAADLGVSVPGAASQPAAA